MRLCDPIMQTCGLWRRAAQPRLIWQYCKDQPARGARHDNCLYPSAYPNRHPG